MKIKTKILAGFIGICMVGFYLFLDTILNDIRPMYLESSEESLNDTATILATLMENHLIKDKNRVRIDIKTMENIFEILPHKKLDSKIFQFNKTKANIHVYVTDHKGIVLYDSYDKNNIGKDFSKWNDVHQTLKGKYGARSSSLIESDKNSRAVYVASPIKHRGKIIGVVTAIKPKQSIATFVDLSRKKVIIAAIITFFIFVILSIILSFWINIPIKKLTIYVKSLLTEKNTTLPDLSSPEMKELGITFEEIFNQLEGKKYIENYIQTLTHEIKSPLTSIIGAAELVNEESMPDDKKKVFHNNILKEARRIERMVKRLLLLSSLENRKVLNNTEDIKLVETIEEIIETLKSQITKKNISISFHKIDEYIISGEFFLIRQAIVNLLQNAINFVEDGGKISIKIDSTLNENDLSNKVIISISDNGIGIPDYGIDKIFDKFYSLPAFNTSLKSSGLGLPFVREVALLHGGNISIENNPDKGVRARLALPII